MSERSAELLRQSIVSRVAGHQRRSSTWLRARARALRRDPTRAEQLLWQRLSNRRLLGLKFRRQHIVGGYIADFYCCELCLVVEVDGGCHRETRAYDDARDAWMQAHHLTVLRFTNEEVAQRMDQVSRRIMETAADLLEARER